MLNMDPVVRVDVAVGTNLVPAGVFDVGAILTATAGTGTPLSTTNRFAVYSGLAELKNGVEDTKPAFATSTDVYEAAAKYFGVNPVPASIVVIFYDTTTGTTDSPAIALADAVEAGAEFYGVYYSGAASITADAYKTNALAVVSALESLKRGVLFYGATGTATSITAAGAIMSAMKATGSRRAIGIACATDANDAAGLMGVAMGYGRSSANRAFALCYKPIASATLNDFTQSEVDAIKAINGNVYVARTRTRGGMENGAVASGLRYDEVLYIDRFVSEIQANIYTMIADSPAKLPQTDDTTTLFISEIYRILENYYNIGVLADAVWRGTNYEGMEEDMIIDHGYYAFADTFDNQSDADRAQHKAMPITVLVCFSGSVESIEIFLDVQT